MLDEIIYSDSIERLGKTASKTLDIVDKGLETVGLTLDAINIQLKDLASPEDKEIVKLNKAIKKARKLEILKRSADKLGLKLEDLK